MCFLLINTFLLFANKNMLFSLPCCKPAAPPHFSKPLFVPLSSSPLSPPAGDFLVLSQKKISSVTWLKWQTKIPSPLCSTDPLLSRRPGGGGRRQRGGGGVPPGRLRSLTHGPVFVLFSFFHFSF